jgi:hypothetical protein
VINVDKITKVHRKLGGHRSDIWQELVGHMRSLIERKRLSQEEICKYVSDALIKHIDESDRERTQRKVGVIYTSLLLVNYSSLLCVCR